ncbi:MAG: VanZ family protein [Allorhizobium sp.]
MTIRRFVRFAAWTGLALIVFVTVVPIEARPPTITSNNLDRALAFLGMSALFVIAYPRRVLSFTVVLFFAAFVIELVQFASKTRHPQFQDAVVKALGVLLGVAAGWFTNFLSRRGAKSP